MEKHLESLKIANSKPSLLLHSCCGPCSSVALERLTDYFNVTLLFYNPNIQPKEEFLRRQNEQQKLINRMSYNINVIAPEYNEQEFLEYVKGLESLPEGSFRCQKCFELRLKRTARIAKEINSNYFTTTLTTSPHKDAQIINQVGFNVSKGYNVEFLCTDFKKKDGYKRSIELSKRYDLYRQNYCGCLFSLKKY
ncbi:MAG: epoxyqueuosine reductase QueH [Oscillospiraceae bacterium]|nr:epoxyqueuosine reductase QueH [Oscillospiraceae bacterium]